jgi:hypothetical protein
MNAFGSMFIDMQKVAAAFRGNGASMRSSRWVAELLT